MSILKQSQEYKDRIKEKLKRAFKSEEKCAWTGFFIKRYRFTYLIMFVLILSGFYSMLTLPREAEPEVKVPFAVVTTVYPGSTPTDVEDLITNKIEDEIDGLENLSRYSSTSGQGFSSIFVEYKAEADLKESFRKLREAVDRAEPKLPSEAEAPSVNEVNFNDFPIVTYSLVGNYTDAELKKYADKLQVELEKIKGVSEAPIRGGREREYQVIVDQTKLANFNISLGQIVNAIQSTNFSLPAGDIEVDGFNYTVRLDGKFSEAHELNDIVISTYDGSPIFLRDIALVKDDFKDRSTESRIGFLNEISKNTISLQIYKKTGGNILNIVRETNEAVDNVHQNGIFPESLEVLKTNDNSVFIRKDLKTLGTSGIQTVILITLILIAVLSLSGAIITAMSVPIAFLMSFSFLKLQGMTINSMVLFSLVLSLGLMVDNAIIIIEGINEYISRHKKNIYEAAILSVWNFKWAIIAGTMTTVSAFLPMLLVSGIMGEYLGIMPKTIAVTLLSSLFVAIIIIPTLASRFIKIKSNGTHSHRNKKRHKHIDGFMNKLYEKYVAFLTPILPNKKKRRKYIIAVWVLFAISVATPFLGIMRIEMFPKIDFDYFNVNIKSPVGTTMEKTDEVVREIEEEISKIKEVENYVTTLGVSSADGFGESGASGDNRATVIVNLSDINDRDATSYAIAEDLRNSLKNVQGAEVTIQEMTGGPPSGAPIEVRIFGSNTKSAAVVAEDVKEYLKKQVGVINVTDSMEDAAGEFTFSVDKQKANYYGLSIINIASTLRQAVYGTKASTVNIDNEDVDITVKYTKDSFNNATDLENILLFTATGENIQLKQVAELELEPALLSINHRDGKNIVTVSADVEYGTNVASIMKDFEKHQKTLALPQGIEIAIGGETEDIEKSFREMFLSLFVALVLIGVILTLQFNSFKQPFIILFALPLALIGVIIGLNILRQPFSITAFIGIVSLSGIVVNDAIVLIDRINKNIKNGMDFFESILEAGVARMQPIFITSLTTIAGVFPLIFAQGMWIGLSLTIIFGLMFSTVLILFIIPMFYAGMCHKDSLHK